MLTASHFAKEAGEDTTLLGARWQEKMLGPAGLRTPLHLLTTWLAHGSQKARGEITATSFQWIDDTLIRGPLSLDVSRYKAFIAYVIEQAQSACADFEALLEVNLSNVNVSGVYEDLSNAAAGYSAVHETRNKDLLKNLPQLLPRLVATSARAGSASIEVAHARLSALLSVALYFSSSYLMRMTTFYHGTRITNVVGASRNLHFVEGGILVHMCASSKSASNVRARSRESVRIVPQPLQHVCRIYLLVIRPALDIWRSQRGLAVHPHLLIDPSGDPMTYDAFSSRISSSMALGGIGAVHAQFCRHLTIAVGRRWLGDLDDGLHEEEDEQDSPTSSELGMAEEAGHSVATARLHYARLPLAALGTPHLLAEATLPSRRFQAWLGLVPAWSPPVADRVASPKLDAPLGTNAVASAPATLPSIQVMPTIITLPSSSARQRPSLSTSSLSTLADWSGPDFCFGLDLYDAHAVQEAGASLLVVLPTGSGKSTLFQLHANENPRSLTVVLVPYRQLVIDAAARSARLGLQVLSWPEQRPTINSVGLLFMTTDAAASAALPTLTELGAQRRISRVFVDEGHVVLSEASFRSRLGAVASALRATSCPATVMTGSLPPRLEQTLKDRLEAPWLYTIRSRTLRVNVSVTVRSSASDAAAASVIKATIAHTSPRACMILCRTVQATKEMAEKLSCPLFYAAATEQEACGLRRWLDGVGSTICVTSAACTGLHRPDVDLVICHGWPHDITTLLQVMGRAGRDGNRASFLLMYSGPVPSTMDAADANILRALAAEKVCRSKVLSPYLDGGSPLSCQELAASPCDLCTMRNQAAALSRKRSAQVDPTATTLPLPSKKQMISEL